MHVPSTGVGVDEVAQPAPVVLDQLAGKDRDARQPRPSACLEERRQASRKAPGEVAGLGGVGDHDADLGIERGLRQASRLMVRVDRAVDHVDDSAFIHDAALVAAANQEAVPAALRRQAAR